MPYDTYCAFYLRVYNNHDEMEMEVNPIVFGMGYQCNKIRLNYKVNIKYVGR